MKCGEVAVIHGRLAAVLVTILAVVAPALAGTPLLTPTPKEVSWNSGQLKLSETPTIMASMPEEQQPARLLAAELERLHRVRPKIAIATDAARIELALADSPRGQACLKQWDAWAKWPVPRNPDEAYVLQVDSQTATVVAGTPRGLLFGCQTLLQLVQTAEADRSLNLPAVRIRDWPQLSFRGVHLCIFPNTELAAIRQAILLAARYKYNAVVIEPWASLKSHQHPETAYEHAYTPDEIRPLVHLGQALHLDMIPMLNSWGHASGMRATSAEHVVLDRFPEHRSLYEPDGWSFRLSNPAVRQHLFDRYGELLELFGAPRYFHAGMDEAWGHLGLAAGVDQGQESRELLARHLHEIHDYFADRKIQVFMWHDMFIQRDDPKVGKAGPANSVPPFNTHFVLEGLPKDAIIAAWNYGATDTGNDGEATGIPVSG